jgi:hypothetical protein
MSSKAEFKSFVDKNVIPTNDIYLEFIDTLKRRSLFQILEWAEEN